MDENLKYLFSANGKFVYIENFSYIYRYSSFKRIKSVETFSHRGQPCGGMLTRGGFKKPDFTSDFCQKPHSAEIDPGP